MGVLVFSSSSQSTMSLIKQIETAGKTPGLQVWRVVKLELENVPPQFHGEFYEGDSYIVLYTSSPNYNLHTWMGRKFRFFFTKLYFTTEYISCHEKQYLLYTGHESSQDEKGAAAIIMTQIDDSLGGAPVQFTEYPNQESDIFLSYFKTGLRYKVRQKL